MGHNDVAGVWGDSPAERGKDGTVSWTIIIPVKRLEFAKSRLRGTLADTDHDALVLAMALDTVSAALASPVVGRVVVVTGDETAADSARDLGAEVIQDVPDAGLNPALAYAATHVRPKGATATLPGVAALSADLPALRTEDLTEALRMADAVTLLIASGDNRALIVSAEGPASSGGSQGAVPEPARVFVADAAGTGTVLLAAAPGAPLEPCFGPGSAAAHAASGAVELTGDWPSLRRDVDTAADLADANTLGVGPRTLAVVSMSANGGAGAGGANRHVQGLPNETGVGETGAGETVQDKRSPIDSVDRRM